VAKSKVILAGEHRRRVEGYVSLLEKLYGRATARFFTLAQSVGFGNEDEMFAFSDFKELNAGVDDIVKSLALGIKQTIIRGTNAEWRYGNQASSNATVQRVLDTLGMKRDALSNAAHSSYFDNHDAALRSFQARKIGKGDTLSKRVWELANQHKLENELAISVSRGTSASDVAKQIEQYLKEPDKLYRRVRDEYGELQLSKKAKAYNPGAGVYRSSYKNAMRLARTEINMAYRNAEQKSYEEKDYVVGYEIHRSTHDYDCDVCESLKGKYPKDFEWNGWHPNCYSDDSKVLTSEGWKLFKDVSAYDRILSLNPDTKSVEYVGIADMQCYPYNGELVRFWNKSLDILVTPEHRMVYLNKTTGAVNYCPAEEYKSTKGATYRSSVYDCDDIVSIHIGKYVYRFDDFVEFLGYWLADGSIIGNCWISISQKDGEAAKPLIISVVSRLGYKPTVYEDSVRFYDTKLVRYLSQFGKCDEKFVPECILCSSIRQIRIFLDAFIKCDGSVRKPRKAFVGNRGTEFVPKSEERLYFTTSQKLAGNLCELIVKVGHHPTIRKKMPGVSVKNDGGVICSSKICYVIQECVSATASVFSKERIQYSGYVYDLTLSRNHIMFIERKGFVFWGSNCRCYMTPILISEDEMRARRMAIINGEEFDASKSENAVNDVPDNFKEWVSKNEDRINAAADRGTLPYFLRDNEDYVSNALQSLASEHDEVVDINTRDYLKAHLEEFHGDVKSLANRMILGASSSDTIGIAMSIQVDKYNDGISVYRDAMTEQSKVMRSLYEKYDATPKEDWATRLKLGEEIRHKSSVLTRFNLRQAGAVDGLEFSSYESGHVFMSSYTAKLPGGGTAVVPAYKKDVVKYIDSSGHEYWYPVGANKGNIPFKANDAASVVKDMFPGMKKSFNAIMFDYDWHPNDAYFQKVYPNFEHGAMYGGEPITVHYKYISERRFKEDLSHEIGHHIDRDFKTVSGSKKWRDAIAKDGRYVSKYAESAPVEDFAETFEWMYTAITDSGGIDKIEYYFKSCYPNRWSILKPIMQKLMTK